MLIPIVLLLIIVSAIFGLNFEPGTWLSGWDNLHPELNFSINLSRSFFSVWQEYQGLGLLGGMGHASDLFRQIFLWITSFILPTQLMRYFYHFLMLFVGSLGVYYLLENKLLNKFEKGKRFIPSLAGAIFYIFNLGTLQMFYFPFEAFSAHFAFLPWLFWSVLNFIEKEDKKAFLWFVLVNLLAVSQGYVATVFLVYFMSLCLFLLYYLRSKKNLKKIFIIIGTTLIVNSFWLLPNIYFVIKNVDVNLYAKINEMATQDNLLKNLAYGNLQNTTILKGFLFNNLEFNQDGVSTYIMGSWVKYTQNPLVLFLGYSLFLFVLLGIYFLIKRKLWNLLPFLFISSFGFILLSNNTFGFSLIDKLLYHLPLFSQIFRFPFTKFAILTAFGFSIFYAVFISNLLEYLKNKYLKILVGIVFCILPLVYLFPIFQGELFYNKITSKIPNEYFQVFDFFNKQDKGTRIANLPQTNFWGWTLYRWNYSGSGFLWYGINQPILDRAFDPWSSQNENYYWEMSYAIYSKNQALLEKVLEKYQINWLLVDGNVINPSSPKALYLNELDDLIYSSLKIKSVAQFGQVKIYKVNLENSAKDFVFLNNNLPIVSSTYKWNNYDQAFLDNSNYISNSLTASSSPLAANYYPFRSLFTGKRQEDLEFKIREDGNDLIFESVIPKEYTDAQIVLPENLSDELFWINPENLGEQKIIKPDVSINNQKIFVKFLKIDGYYSANLLPSQTNLKENPQNCNQFTKGNVSNKLIDNYWLRLSAVDANNCSASFWLPNLAQNLSYLIKVESRYQEGKPLLFWLENLNSQKADIETYLDKTTNNKPQTSYFIQPPMASDGLGYTLHFDNISIGQEKSVNDLNKVSVYQIPWNYLLKLKFVNNQTLTETQKTLPISVKHPNPSFYEIELAPSGKNSTLILSQSFSDGWQGYEMADGGLASPLGGWQIANSKLGGILTPLIGKRINNHVLVNNWENGWQLNGGTKIALIFWPQYLEYLGFLLLLILAIILASWSFIKRQKLVK